MSDYIESDSIDAEDSKIEGEGWANPPKLTDLKADMAEANESHQAHVTEVDEWLQVFRGGEELPKVPNRSSYRPRLARKQAEWRYPALSEPFLSTDDIFNVYGVTADDVDNARSAALVLNHMFRKAVNVVNFFDEYARCAVEEGSVILKTGWNLVEEGKGNYTGQN